MSIYTQNNEFFDQPISLCEEEKANPLAVLAGFFDAFRLHEVREYIDRFRTVTLIASNDEFTEKNDRESADYFFTKLITMCEAASILQAGVNPLDSVEEQ